MQQINQNMFEDIIFEIEKSHGCNITKSEVVIYLEALERNIKYIKKRLDQNHIYNFIEHGERIFQPTLELSIAAGCPHNEALFNAYAARIHDIGKNLVSRYILNKYTSLIDNEREELRKHVFYGTNFVSTFPELSKIVKHHHEWYNGKGYPDKLKNDAIPLGSRIIAITECWDAMTFKRHYSIPKSTDEAKTELENHAGKQFDPKLVKLFLNNMLYNQMSKP